MKEIINKRKAYHANIKNSLTYVYKSPMILKAETAPQADTTNNKELPTTENYDRAMVNFMGGTVTPRKILNKQDKALMATLTNILGLTKEKALALRKEFKTFLAENSYLFLNDVKFEKVMMNLLTNTIL